MTAKAIPQTAASLRRDSRSSPRNPESGGRPVRRSFFSHPALLVILAAGCLALAVPYIRPFTPQILAFASSVTLALRADTAVSPAPDAARPDVGFMVAAAAAKPPARAASAAATVPPAPDAAAAIAATVPPAPEDALQVVQSNFDPVLLERLEVAAPETVADVIMGADGAPVVTVEQLRILAQMTPEQIDALTFLILSLQDPKAAAVTVDQTNAVADDAPWVGDWTSGDLSAESAVPSAAVEPPQNDLLKGWYVFEASADEAVIRNIDDPLSAVRVSPGTVLGNLGFVSEIKIDAGRAKVVLSGGDVILSDDSAVILAEVPASAPEQTEQRRGPPFEIALAAAQNKPQASSDAVASDAVASDAVASDAAASDAVASDAVASDAVASDAVASDAVASGDATTPVLDPPPAVTKQTTSTKADPKQPAAKSGAGAGRYVQVATFKSAANAQIAKNMVMSDGMTGQLRKTTRQGASFHRVLAGPFDPAEIQKALTRVTRLGFKDAFIIR